MKNSYSPQWVASVQPRKQRKFRANAPLHKKHKFLSAHLSSSLQEKYDKRSLPLRKGDEVLVMRGSFKKKKAKISSVNLKQGFAYLEGMQRTKKDGTKVNVPFSPSALLIQVLASDDKLRISSSKKDLKSSSDAKPQTKPAKSSPVN
jgi:large subunit ribosomal protein L24